MTNQKISRKTALLGVGALALLAAGAAGLHWWQLGRFLISTDDAYVRADIATISPRVAGYISRVAVRDNQAVAAGEVLAQIDDAIYRARLAQADGALTAAKARVLAQQAAIANLRAQAGQQHSLIAAATAETQARQADLRQAELAYQRQQLLTRQQVTDAQHLEAAEASASRGAAALEAARANGAASKARLAVLATQGQQAEAALHEAEGAQQQAEATRALAQLDLDHTVIRAPVAGLVGQRSLRVGAYVAAGTPLMALVPQQIYVVANYKEVQLDGVAAGQQVEIEVDALGGRALKGHVDSLAPASGAQFAVLPPDNASGNFTKIVQRIPVRISLDAGQPLLAELRPGMSVVTAVDLRRASKP
ncbi:HlyD family secretion protein [Duganella guangzhouensis]|nr:HlyD family secretion protein [Duganella guangzhouensis]